MVPTSIMWFHVQYNGLQHFVSIQYIHQSIMLSLSQSNRGKSSKTFTNNKDAIWQHNIQHSSSYTTESKENKMMTKKKKNKNVKKREKKEDFSTQKGRLSER